VDIEFHDRTQYDIKIAQTISDYVILHGQVKSFAIKHLEKLGQNKSIAFLDDLENLLNTKIGKSSKRGGVLSKKNMNKDDNNNNTIKFTSIKNTRTLWNEGMI
jgi:hypothetical protein